jgi:hypothetical protein
MPLGSHLSYAEQTGLSLLFGTPELFTENLGGGFVRKSIQRYGLQLRALILPRFVED